MEHAISKFYKFQNGQLYIRNTKSTQFDALGGFLVIFKSLLSYAYSDVGKVDITKAKDRSIDTFMLENIDTFCYRVSSL
jgi:hypothetical protein